MFVNMLSSFYKFDELTFSYFFMSLMILWVFKIALNLAARMNETITFKSSSHCTQSMPTTCINRSFSSVTEHRISTGIQYHIRNAFSFKVSSEYASEGSNIGKKCPKWLIWLFWVSWGIR